MVKRRKSQVAPPPPQCTLRECMRVVSGAWTADILWQLSAGERCYSELQNDVKGISAKVLSARLRMLEKARVIDRLPRPTSPPTIWYQLTPLGLELYEAMSRIIDVSQRLKQA